MACTLNMTYRSQKSAANSAAAFGGAAWGLRVFYCDEHQGWHYARDQKQKRKPCPRCGEWLDRMRTCRCMREALQEADPWGR